MKIKKLCIISGPDRAGKSTLSEDLKKTYEVIGFKAYVQHWSEPSPYMKDIFERFRVSISQFMSRDETDVLIWDRSHVCAYILERFRNNSHSFIGDLIAFEVFLSRQENLVVEHIGLTPPWYVVSRLHLKEIEELNPECSDWAVARDLLTRANEHRFYTEELADFYQNLTMFPNRLFQSRSEVFEFLTNVIDQP